MAGAGLADRLFVVGFGHRTCPAALRERLFLDDSAVPGLLTALASVGVEQGLALSTCDRIEIHGLADRVGEATFDAVLGALAVAAGLPSADIAGLAYRQRGLAALRHLFAVACSLDSRTIGEPQVLGQLRAAHRIARDAGRVGAELETFLQTAYGTAKSVRGETAIAERPISMAAVAARLARDLHGDLARCGGILIGGEDIGELLVEQLMSAGLGRMTMVGRTRRGAAARAARLGCHFATIEELAQVLFEADVVVSSFGEGRHVLTGAMV
ncbi:MAG: glutamyl-tRNA reductase, partial [Alphaproteobacteria bacterium]|nr:glutamyl-tRNA reductase [Alphaproteobacteria bacterium]